MRLLVKCRYSFTKFETNLMLLIRFPRLSTTTHLPQVIIRMLHEPNGMVSKYHLPVAVGCCEGFALSVTVQYRPRRSDHSEAARPTESRRCLHRRPVSFSAPASAPLPPNGAAGTRGRGSYPCLPPKHT